jgi:hypothetical protein
MLQDVWRNVIEDRKTFQSDDKPHGPVLFDPVFVDERYCHELLAGVPKMVKRTLELRRVVLPKGADAESTVYLRESATCLVFGLPQATVVLARAAIESCLRKACSDRFGETAVRAIKFSALVGLCQQGRILQPTDVPLATAVGKAANAVLHERPIDHEKAHEVFENARLVIFAVTQPRQGRRERRSR